VQLQPLAGNETRNVSQHAMQNHGEFAGERDFALRMPGRVAAALARGRNSLYPTLKPPFGLG
jgi:hypothetical protein